MRKTVLKKATKSRSFFGLRSGCVRGVGDCNNLWRKLDDELLQLVGVGSTEAFDLLTLLDEHECWHRRDVVLHGEFFTFVNINLKWNLPWKNAIKKVIIASYLDDDELVGVGIGKFFQFRGDHLARSAPGGVEVNQYQKISGRFQFGIKISLRTRRWERMRERSWTLKVTSSNRMIHFAVTIHLLSFNWRRDCWRAGVWKRGKTHGMLIVLEQNTFKHHRSEEKATFSYWFSRLLNNLSVCQPAVKRSIDHPHTYFTSFCQADVFVFLVPLQTTARARFRRHDWTFIFGPHEIWLWDEKSETWIW